MSALIDRLREELRDREYREGYDEAFLDHVIATQIRVLREQREWTQKQLADAADMKQSRISAMEDEDYGSWSINTLRRIAYALGVRLRVEFAEWGTLLRDIETAGRENLQRRRFEDDSVFNSEPVEESATSISGEAFGAAATEPSQGSLPQWRPLEYKRAPAVPVFLSSAATRKSLLKPLRSRFGTPQEAHYVARA